MAKKINKSVLVLNLVAVLIIGVLYVIFFSDKTREKKATSEIPTDVTVKKDDSTPTTAQTKTNDLTMDTTEDNFNDLSGDDISSFYLALWPLINFDINDFGNLIEFGLNSQIGVNYYTLYCVYQRDESIDALKEEFESILIGDWTYSDYSGYSLYGGKIEDYSSATCGITAFVASDAYTGSRIFLSFVFEADTAMIDDFMTQNWPSQIMDVPMVFPDTTPYFNGFRHFINQSFELNRSWQSDHNDGIFETINAAIENSDGYFYTPPGEYVGAFAEGTLNAITVTVSNQTASESIEVRLKKSIK